MSDFLFQATPNQDAIRFLKDKAAVSRAVFDGLLPELKARAFTITGLESATLLKKLRDRIADLPAGAAWGDVKADLVKDLSPLTEGDAAAAERRATTLLRMHGFQAYTVAQEQVGQRQKDVFPFAQYASADDPRVRPTHSALDGIVLPVDSEFWRDHTPPWEYGCRCRKIFLSHDDVAELEAEDAKKIPEARRVIVGARRDKLEKEGTFLTAENGVPRSLDVRGPRAKFGGSAYSFDPGSLELSLDDIKARYKDTPEVWANFETWAKATEIPDQSRTVWEWLAQAPATAPATPAAPLATIPPASSPPLAVSPPLTLRRAPVSAAITPAKIPAALATEVRATLAAIDRVHDDGLLPALRLDAKPQPSAYGTFFGGANRIAVKADGPWPRLTTAHEVGHALDYQVLGTPGAFASAVHPALAPWREAVAASATVRSILERQRSPRPVYRAEYLLRDRELWARSYAQFIAERSGDPELLRQLDVVRGRSQHVQWSTADFAAISAAIAALFKTKNWM